VTPAATLASVALRFGFTPADLREKRRGTYLDRARTTAYRSLRRLGMSYGEIGRLMGRDHTAVLYAIRGEKR
jgi:chromosomal replication initiation ATPase DnaA